LVFVSRSCCKKKKRKKGWLDDYDDKLPVIEDVESILIIVITRHKPLINDDTVKEFAM
jgi:hypothetical protein